MAEAGNDGQANSASELAQVVDRTRIVAEKAEAESNKAATAAVAAEKARDRAEIARRAAETNWWSKATAFLGAAGAVAAVLVAWCQLDGLRSEARARFAYQVFGDLVEPLKTMIAHPGMTVEFSSPGSAVFDPNSVDPAIGNLVRRAFNHFALSSNIQKKYAIVDSVFWEDMINLTCSSFKGIHSENVIAFLKEDASEGDFEIIDEVSKCTK